MTNNDTDILNRHKKDIICDLCRRRIWFFQKAYRRIVSEKDNVWAEYYHLKCLIMVGWAKKVKKESRDRDDDDSTSNLVH